MKFQFYKTWWGIRNPEKNSFSFKRTKMFTYKIVQEAKQADITISWVILHYRFVWFGFCFSSSYTSQVLQIRNGLWIFLLTWHSVLCMVGSCKYAYVCVTPPGYSEQGKTWRPSLLWEKVTVKVGFHWVAPIAMLHFVGWLQSQAKFLPAHASSVEIVVSWDKSCLPSNSRTMQV